MKKLLGGIAFACLGLAAPAAANEVSIPTRGSSGVSGTDGNGRIFTGTNGTTVINVRVSGWSLDGNTIRDSFLGAFDRGLGVTSGDDMNGDYNLHTIDNDIRRDFILLQFDQAVALGSGTFSVYRVVGDRDSDVSFAFGTTSADWRSQFALDGANASTLASMFSGGGTSLGANRDNTRDLGAGGAAGNLWLLGADFTNADGRVDAFKLDGITVSAVASAVPEPGTWATMLIGFGAVGAAMRRRPRAVLATA